MAESRKRKKGLLSGRRVSLVGLRKKGSVIAKVGSYLKREKPITYVLRVPHGKPVGKVTWAVDFGLVSVNFRTKRKAEEFQKLLSHSVEEYPSDIVRREITQEGYFLD